mgnify:CR=1 FL=1
MPTRGGDCCRPDRQTVDIERVRAMSFQRAPIDNHACGTAFRADGERRDDDVRDAAILLQRA